VVAFSPCLEKGALKDFKVFGNGFFESLNGFFSYLFGDKVEKKPVKARARLSTLAEKVLAVNAAEVRATIICRLGQTLM
jgi:hypothetical protein